MPLMDFAVNKTPTKNPEFTPSFLTVQIGYNQNDLKIPKCNKTLNFLHSKLQLQESSKDKFTSQQE